VCCCMGWRSSRPPGAPLACAATSWLCGAALNARAGRPGPGPSTTPPLQQRPAAALMALRHARCGSALFGVGFFLAATVLPQRLFLGGLHAAERPGWVGVISAAARSGPLRTSRPATGSTNAAVRACAPDLRIPHGIASPRGGFADWQQIRDLNRPDHRPRWAFAQPSLTYATAKSLPRLLIGQRGPASTEAQEKNSNGPPAHSCGSGLDDPWCRPPAVALGPGNALLGWQVVLTGGGGHKSFHAAAQLWSDHSRCGVEAAGAGRAR